MKALKALGIHIFAGGQTLGVREHFDLLGHLENAKGFGCETSARNLNIPVYVGPSEEWPLDVYRGKVDYMPSNPPCAIFSVSAARANRPHWSTDPRLSCVEECFMAFEGIRPHAWSWESVRQAFTKGRTFVDEITERVLKLTGPLGSRYAVTHLYTAAHRHGVSQPRARWFLVAHDVDIDFVLPRVKRLISGDAIFKRPVKYDPAGLPRMPPHVIKLLKKTPPGEGPRYTYDQDKKLQLKAAYYVTRNENVPQRPNFMQYRLDPEKLCGTMIGGCHVIHPYEARYLHWREVAVLSGYPRWYEFYGNAYAEINKAVLPPVGEYMGRMVAAGIRRAKPPGYRVRFVDVSGDELLVEHWR